MYLGPQQHFNRGGGASPTPNMLGHPRTSMMSTPPSSGGPMMHHGGMYRDHLNGANMAMKKLSLLSSAPDFVPGRNGVINSSSLNCFGTSTAPSSTNQSSRTASPNPSANPVSGDLATSSSSSLVTASGDFSSFNDGGTTYFYNSSTALDEMSVGDQDVANGVGHSQHNGPSVLIPDFQSYTGNPITAINSKVKSNTPGFMADNELRMNLLRRQLVCLAQIDPESHPNLPTEVDNFTNLCPLEASSSSAKSNSFGYLTSVYKATNMKNGQHVCLRRIHGYRLVNTKCMTFVEQWKKLHHSNIVSLRQVFTTKSFGDHSMVFVYDLHACAETLKSKHFSSPSQQASKSAFLDPFGGAPEGARPYSQHKNQILRQQAMLSQNGLLNESLIWNYVIQLTSALRHIHSAGLAFRNMDPTKILVINKNRLMLNCCGISDVLSFDSNSSNPNAAIPHYQQEDLVSLGKIVLALACNSLLAIQRENLQTSMEIVSSTYSSDLRNLIVYLLTQPNRVKSVNDLMPMIGARFYTQLEQVQQRCDSVEAELAKEIESARLFRLVTKLCTVVDRAELNGDFGWAEYGDRYMLKLFRDYVFHQVMEDGRPWLDMAHVVTCLNRLDSGSHDKICLVSRDEQNVLVVSYAELKNCLEQSFSECIHAQKNPTFMGVHNY